MKKFTLTLPNYDVLGSHINKKFLEKLLEEYGFEDHQFRVEDGEVKGPAMPMLPEDEVDLVFAVFELEDEYYPGTFNTTLLISEARDLPALSDGYRGDSDQYMLEVFHALEFDIGNVQEGVFEVSNFDVAHVRKTLEAVAGFRHDDVFEANMKKSFTS